MIDGTPDFLLVDDSSDDSAFFVRIFRKTGVPGNLHVAADGREALDFVYGTGAAAPRRPRVIFLDLKLPKVGGTEVLRRLKSDAATRSIPIVVLTSSDEERDIVESYALGVNSYIVKQLDFDALAQSLGIMVQYWLQFNQTPKR